MRFEVKGEKEFYDIYPPDKFLDATPDLDPTVLSSHDKFQKDQSLDFYMGMIAGLRVAQSVVRSWINETPHLIADYLTDCSLSATLLAKDKK